MNRKKKIGIIMLVMGIILTEHVSYPLAKVVVVVNNANSAATVKRSTWARYFLKKSTSWESGAPVVPVDLKAADPAREEFSNWILNMSPQRVEAHWISETLTGGKLAPEIVNSAALVKKRVASEPGGIGYIDGAELDASVKAVEVVE